MSCIVHARIPPKSPFKDSLRTAQRRSGISMHRLSSIRERASTSVVSIQHRGHSPINRAMESTGYALTDQPPVESAQDSDSGYRYADAEQIRESARPPVVLAFADLCSCSQVPSAGYRARRSAEGACDGCCAEHTGYVCGRGPRGSRVLNTALDRFPMGRCASRDVAGAREAALFRTDVCIGYVPYTSGRSALTRSLVTQHRRHLERNTSRSCRMRSNGVISRHEWYAPVSYS